MKVHITDKRTKVKVSKSDLWNLDITLSKIILPCLVKFRANLDGWPSILNQEDEKEALKEWEGILDQMIEGFGMNADCVHDDTKVQNALDLFAKYYTHLWN